MPETAPPIGLVPKFIHDERTYDSEYDCNKARAFEILEAMQRYVKADKKIPKSWFNELHYLTGK